MGNFCTFNFDINIKLLKTNKVFLKILYSGRGSDLIIDLIGGIERPHQTSFIQSLNKHLLSVYCLWYSFRCWGDSSR